MTTPNLKLRSPVPFPANVTGAGGISVTKTNGEWVIAPDFDDLAVIPGSAVSDPTSKQIWIFDPVTDAYNVLTLAALGDALYAATSTSSLAIATGSKTFTTQSGKDFAVGSWVIATSNAGATNYMLGQVTSYSTTSLVVNVTTIGGSGTHTDWTIRASSAPGAAGKSSGFSFLWNTDTTSSDPGSGKVKANNATLSSATTLYISETDNDGNALAPILATWDDGTSTIRGRLKIYNPVSPTNFATFDVTGTLTDNGTWDTFSASYVGSGGTFANNDALYVFFVPKGDKGDTGTAGVHAGVLFNFATSTTMADPSSGNIRLNNATLASVTAAAISANSADSGNPSVSAWINTFDDSTTTSHRGYLVLRKASALQNFVIYDVTGALTDNTTWLQLTLTYIVGGGSFSAADSLAISFIRTGDKGAAGAGSGDLISTNNLSDVGSAATSRTNLGLGTGNSPQFTGIEVGNASDTTLTRDSAGVIAIEGVALYSNIPQNSKSANYTTLLSDAQKHIYHPSSDNNARTFTIDSNANVAYPVGSVITFVNEINTVTIAITSDTLTMQGTGSTGSRTLAANGVATAMKVATTKWIISGTGLT